MWPYICIAVIVIVFSSLDLFQVSKGLKQLGLVVLFILLALFVGLRDNIGFDWSNYELIYDDLSVFGQSIQKVEFGYVWLNSLFIDLGLSFNALVLFIAFLSLGLKCFFIGRYSELIFIPLLFYLSYYLVEYEMSGMRQSIAMGFAMVSLFYVRRRLLLPFLSCIFAGAIFHISIVAFIPIYFINKLNFAPSTYVTLLIAGLFLVFSNFMDLLMGVANSLPLGNFVMEKLLSYSARKSTTGLTFGHLPYMFFALLFIYYKRLVHDPFYNTLLNGFIAGTILSLLFSGSFPVLNRLTYYYLMLGAFLFSSILLHTSYMLNRLVLFALLSSFLIFKIVESINAPEATKHYLPYRTITMDRSTKYASDIVLELTTTP